MNKLLTCIIAVCVSFSALAEHHESAEAEVRAAAKAFNTAYASNDVEGYFGYYAEDATVYFFGEWQNIAAYHDEWVELMAAGGGVEKNDESDLVIQVMPSQDVAIATYFILNVVRYADGNVITSKAFETDVWQKIDGKWLIISLHYSDLPAE